MSNINKISAAVALALGVSGTAFAAPSVTKATYISSPGTFTNIYIGGATAQNEAIERAVTTLCDPAGGEMAAYRATNESAFLCKALPSLGLSKTNLAVFKESLVGSGNGVAPVASSLTLSFLDLTSATCANVGPTLVTQASPLSDYYISTCSTTPVVGAVPGLGFSDVEPGLFPGVVQAQVDALSYSATNDLVFGIPVTKTVRDVLQTAQGLTSGSDNLDQMPTLPSEAIASMFNGNTTDWSAFSDSSGATLASHTVKICRRPVDSGSQVTTEVVFLHNPCAGTAAAVFKAADGIDVFENASSGDVRTCMNDQNSKGNWAIGLLSTESVAKTADGWRWVKVDNYAPSLLNTVEGNYKYWSGATMQKRAVGATADESAVFASLLSTLQAPALVIALNLKFDQTLGSTSFQAGYLTPAINSAAALPTAGSGGGAGELTNAEVKTNPVNAVSKAYSGVIQNCAVPLPVFEIGLTPSLTK